MDRKYSKTSSRRPCFSKKRRFHGNQYSDEVGSNFSSTSANKLRKSKDESFDVSQNDYATYCFIQFALVFSSLQTIVKCRQCDSDITFSRYGYGQRALGFKIKVQCQCEDRFINSCHMINNAYEINRRFVYVMRLIGVGLQGINFLSATLTNKVMKDLSLYYGLAIQRHPDSVEDMRREIWATFYHKISTDENPQHHLCPEGENSWCKWQQHKAKGSSYSDPPALDEETQEVLMPIYESLCQTDLLERCLGANTQNNNESFNSCVWRLAPKHIFCGKKILEIATRTAACAFNEGQKPILKIFETMGCVLGAESLHFVDHCDSARVHRADQRSSDASKEARIARKEARAAQDELYDVEEGIMYGPGIAD